ncbi:MAG: RNA 2'-phosphotransferase [Anaerolineae bacterium]
MSADLKRLSKFLAVLLRHAPHDFGLTLDEQGFTDADAVWAQIHKRYGETYTPADLDALLASDAGQQRYERVEGRIRALYGHSTVEVAYPPAVPPEILYHGTTPEAIRAIRQEGLNAQARQYVHLSTDVSRASNVATRHGKPVILRVRALEAHKAGLVFHHPEPKHYLARAIPPEYIDFEDES